MSSQLPRTTIPSHYDLVIRTDLVSRTFSGTCEILIRVNEPTPFITIHANLPLKLQAAVLGEVTEDGKLKETRKLAELTIDGNLQRAKLSFEGGAIQEGSYKLGCRWEGDLENSLVGYFYASVPGGGKEEERNIYTMTQFQPCKSLFLLQVGRVIQAQSTSSIPADRRRSKSIRRS